MKSFRQPKNGSFPPPLSGLLQIYNMLVAIRNWCNAFAVTARPVLYFARAASKRYQKRMKHSPATLWPCPKCGRRFANLNQRHSCGRHELADHFNGKSEKVRTIYGEFVTLLETLGPIIVLPEKTRIAFQVRMSFAQLTLRRDWVLGHFVLARRIEDPLFIRVESFSPRNHLHAFRLDSPEDVNRLKGFAREAYAVGRQEHLQRRRRGSHEAIRIGL